MLYNQNTGLKKKDNYGTENQKQCYNSLSINYNKLTKFFRIKAFQRHYLKKIISLPVCVRIWDTRFEVWVKDFSHTAHLWRFCKLWISLCLYNELGNEKHFPQVSHRNGFSPVCILMCTMRNLFCLYLKTNKLHNLRSVYYK